MKKLNILPQYIYKFSLPDELLDHTIKFASELEYPPNSGQSIFDKEEVPQLTSFIENSLEEIRISEGILFEHIKPHLMWANRKCTQQWHKRHTHGNSFVSGIIYLTTCDSRTWFSIPNLWKPQSAREYSLNVYDYNNLDNVEIIHKQESVAGTMLIFPSHLDHSVDNNLSDITRYSISFNAFPCGQYLMDDDKLTNINIQIS